MGSRVRHAARERTPALSLTVAIDGRNLMLAQGTGVATYARSVVSACRTQGFDVRVIASGPGTGRRILPRNLRACLGRRRLRATGDVLLAADLFGAAHVRFGLTNALTALTLPTPVDLVHWTYPLPLLCRGVPNIVTVHDLVPITHPGLSGIDGRRLRRLLARVLARAAHVVTVSEHSRSAILREFRCDPARVSNLGQPVDIPAALLAAAADAPRLCPPGSYVAIGRVEPRKNIARLIAAHRQSGVAAPLVLIGPNGEDAALQREVTVAGDRVIRVPFASRPSLLRALREARCLLLPSLAEGFGLPIVEAMALGTPVITSRGGATEEIAGGAALLVDAESTGSIAAAFRRLDGDATLSNSLAAAGTRRASDFALDHFADRLGALYRRVLGARSGGLDLSGRSG